VNNEDINKLCEVHVDALFVTVTKYQGL